MSLPDDPDATEPPARHPDGSGSPQAHSSFGGFEDFVKGVFRRPREAAQHPRRIDKFQVIDELGVGSYGRVYRVYDPDLTCYRAAKVPTDSVLANPVLRGEFLREARNLQKIDDHPNVVRVVQAGEEDGNGFPYFIMEYCRDRSLATWLQGRKGERADEKWAARLVAQVADGVHRIHQQGLCHRDLKPGNVLLVRVGDGGNPDRPNFCPKVADLGLASVLDDPEATGSILEGPVGTTAYMAPEQARGRRKEIGQASDVYGLGAILFEVVSGRRAYASASRNEIFESLQSSVPSPSLKEACPKASRSMSTIVATAMRKEARYRYKTAADMADDLKRLAEGRPVRGADWPRKAFYFASRHRSALVGAGLALGAAGVAFEARQIMAQASAGVWLRKMETALPGEIAGLIRERNASDPMIVGGLAAMFNADEPTRKLNAALALAAVRPDCAAYAVDRLLALPAKSVGPIARTIAVSVPDLVARLAFEATQARPRVAGQAPFETSHRRVNAALALVFLGQPDSGCLVLGDLDDPTSRSLLVHSMGPAGVEASTILDLSADPATVPPIRRQLLLTLGEFDRKAWPEAERSRAEALALSLYEEDPDAGIHGAAKWLLRRWGRGDQLAKIDANLVTREAKPGFRWRVDASGLTFVVVHDPGNARWFEISDTEVPWRLYRQFDPQFDGPGFGHKLADEEPVLGVGFLEAAVFTNWLGKRAGLGPAFPPPVTDQSIPIASDIARDDGYRLPTTEEFTLAASADTTTSTNRYFGDMKAMIPFYALTAETLGQPGVQGVGQLKPNDLGLFDMLGNALEICHYSGPLKFGKQNQAALCGGSSILPDADLMVLPRQAPVHLGRPPVPSGFRVTRTLKSPSIPRPGTGSGNS